MVENAVRPTRHYLVCAMQRSGSTLLCATLAATGVAGDPPEYFEQMYATGRPRHPSGYFLEGTAPTGLGLGPDEQPGGGEAGSALRESRSWWMSETDDPSSTGLPSPRPGPR